MLSYQDTSSPPRTTSPSLRTSRKRFLEVEPAPIPEAEASEAGTTWIPTIRSSVIGKNRIQFKVELVSPDEVPEQHISPDLLAGQQLEEDLQLAEAQEHLKRRRIEEQAAEVAANTVDYLKWNRERETPEFATYTHTLLGSVRSSRTDAVRQRLHQADLVAAGAILPREENDRRIFFNPVLAPLPSRPVTIREALRAQNERDLQRAQLTEQAGGEREEYLNYEHGVIVGNYITRINNRRMEGWTPGGRLPRTKKSVLDVPRIRHSYSGSRLGMNIERLRRLLPLPATYTCCAGSMTTVDGPSIITDDQLEKERFIGALRLTREELRAAGFIEFRFGAGMTRRRASTPLRYRQCVHGSCETVVKARSLCGKHYRQFERLSKRLLAMSASREF